MSGFIRLDRRFFEGKYWNQSRTFSPAEAWLDLIQSARFEAEPTMKKLPNGRTITVERGEIHASLRYLSVRWGWSKGKVERFLKNTDLGHRMEQGEGILKLCNYDAYNPLTAPSGTVNGTPSGTPARKTGHRRDTGGTNNKKDKNEKNKDGCSVVDKDSSLPKILNARAKKSELVVDLRTGMVHGDEWRTSFEVYVSTLRQCYGALRKDSEWIAERKRLNPNVDILLTMDKVCVEYWATEEGWVHKKKSKATSLNWKTTLSKSIGQKFNHVYEQRNNTTVGRVAEKRESLGELERAALECLFGSQGENRK